MEFARGNIEAAFSLLGELENDYPDGIYGSKAKQAKTELERFAQSLQSIGVRSSSKLSAGIVVAACVLMALVLMLFYFRRRTVRHE